MAGFACAAVACSGAPLPRFPDFAGATRVVVTGLGGADTLAVLTDPARVAAAARFADARNSGWEVPWAGVPVPAVTASFWRGGEFLGSFGAGPHFFGTQRAGTFASRPGDPAEVAEFARVLGVAAPAPE